MKAEYQKILDDLTTAAMNDEADANVRRTIMQGLGVLFEIGDRIATAIEENGRLEVIHEAVGEVSHTIATMGERVPVDPLQFVYTNYKDEREARHVIPLKIEWQASPGFDYEPGWFLTAYDMDRKAPRSFRLDTRLEPGFGATLLTWPPDYRVPREYYQGPRSHAGTVTQVWPIPFPDNGGDKPPGGWHKIELDAPPAAITLQVCYFDQHGGEWVYGMVLSEEIGRYDKPWTHWGYLVPPPRDA